MKKQLLLAAFLMGSFITVKAQTFQSDSFNALTIGNLTEDFTGATAGQDNWYAGGSNGATGTTTTNMTDPASIQIADGGTDHGNVLQIAGPDGSAGGAYAWKDGMSDFWDGRTDGNDILQVEFDYYTGITTDSHNNMRVAIFNTDGSKLLAGINISRNTNIVSGLGYYTDTPGTGTYIFSLGDTDNPDVVLDDNTWVRIGVSYNQATGEIIFKIGGDEVGGSVDGAAAGEDVGEVDIYAISGTSSTVTNTSSASAWFDNINVKTSDVDTLLGVHDVVATTKGFSVYPNPTTGIINVSNADNMLVNNVSIVDLNGRTVKSVKFNGATDAQVNISDLASGVYMMTIASDKGTTTKKIVKN